MNITIKPLLTVRALTLVTLIGILGMFSRQSLAEDQTISLVASECAVTVTPNEGSGCEQGQCEGVEACICAKRGDFITWEMADDIFSKFKLKFTKNSPLKDQCGKNFKNGKAKCKVKEELEVGESFDYLVMLEGCDEGTDPRIVISK
ncbi:hypothetical protein [Shewanella sp. UCD-KL21]|uniref:hypothetical protein n=1 Tax=Shewanella sp. UCD-KL21 TaxID=1917164 RepID=UPI0009710B2D|nr:hypothetical protein [Shewanella sp. UCD-KL21]